MKRKQTSLLISTLVYLLFASLLAGCRSRQPIQVGYCAGLSGYYSEVGITARNSAQLAVDKINAEGGIDGAPLRLLIRDNKGIKGNTLKMMQELVQEGVVTITGPNSSEQTAEVFSFINREKIVLLSAGATSSDFSRQKDYFFRVVPDTDALGTAFADYLHEAYAYPSYRAVYDMLNRTFSDPFLKATDKRLREYGEKIDETVIFDSNTDNTRLVAQKVALGNPKGVILATASIESALLAQFLRQQGSQAQFFGTVWAHTETMIEKGGQAVQGMLLITNNTTLEGNPTYDDYARRYVERYDRQPGLDSFHSYEAVEILALALKHTGGKAEGLPEALVAIHNFPGVLGNISFDAYGDVKRDMYIVRVDGDHFTNVKTISPQD